MPFAGDYPVSQTFAQHKAVAVKNGWCWKPGTGCTAFYYPGIDYAIPVGTAIFASAAGKVTAATTDTSASGGYGKYVKIDHGDGFLTLYGHLSNIIIALAVGSVIEQGKVIGLSGNTGNSTGPHLHWELRINGIPTDPTPYIITEPVIPPSGDKYIVTAEIGLRLRDAPSLTANVIGGMAHGTIVTVIDTEKLTNGTTWHQVTTDAFTGWACAELVTTEIYMTPFFT